MKATVADRAVRTGSLHGAGLRIEAFHVWRSETSLLTPPDMENLSPGQDQEARQATPEQREKCVLKSNAELFEEFFFH